MRAAWIAKTIDGKLPSEFKTLPRQPYTVEPVPAEIAPKYTSGRYVGAAQDGSRSPSQLSSAPMANGTSSISHAPCCLGNQPAVRVRSATPCTVACAEPRS